MEKYGEIVAVFDVSSGASVSVLGGTVETGMVITDQGWVRAYVTTYYSPGFASPNVNGNFSVVWGNNGNRPTFSDWKGASYGISGSFDFISGNIGMTQAYHIVGAGVSFAPAALRFPFSKDTKVSGSANIGTTHWISAPHRFGNLYIPDAGKIYINQMKSGGC